MIHEEINKKLAEFSERVGVTPRFIYIKHGAFRELMANIPIGPEDHHVYWQEGKRVGYYAGIQLIGANEFLTEDITVAM